MKNLTLIIVPIIIIAAVYLFWPAKQVDEKTDLESTNSQTIKKNKIRIVAEERLEDSDQNSQLGQATPNASGNSTDDSDKIEKSSISSVSRYVEKTGASQEFNDLDTMLDSQIEQLVASSDLSEEDKDQITKIFTEHINGDDLLKAYKAELVKEFSEEELQTLEELNSDALVKKIKEDNPLNDPKIGEQVSEYFAELQKNPLSPERQEMIKEIAKATKGADFIVDISQTMMENLGKHMGAKGDAPTPEEMQSFREQLKEEAEYAVQSGLSFQTRNLDDEEMQAYSKNQTNSLVQRDQNIRKGVAKRVTAKMFSEIGKVAN
ncbi:MAG: hypothetical protein AB8G05_16700 [Oligoflexales bacterium]